MKKETEEHENVHYPVDPVADPDFFSGHHPGIPRGALHPRRRRRPPLIAVLNGSNRLYDGSLKQPGEIFRISQIRPECDRCQ